MNTVTEYETHNRGNSPVLFPTREEAEALAIEVKESFDHLDLPNNEVQPVVEKEFGFATHVMYTDCEPYEIVNVVSAKTLEIRPMIAVRQEDSVPNIVPGGFAGHCTNNRSIKYDYKSDPDATTMRIRRKKNGKWGYKKSEFRLAQKPYKFYDYNF